MIRIKYDEGAEMMEIYNNQEQIFCGNYWDFDASPSGLDDFLAQVGLRCSLEEYEYEC